MPSGRHLFRITTAANYTTTNPTAYKGTGTVAGVTIPDGTFTEAVWINVQQACGQCHTNTAGIPHFTAAELSTLAKGMHTNIQANFTWTRDLTTSLKVSFAASGCPTGDTCTYAWDFGQTGGTTTDGTTATPTHTYTSLPVFPATSFTVTVTITDTTKGWTSEPFSKSVVPFIRNTAPVVSNTIAQEGFTVTLTDASTDDVALPAGAVKVNWGTTPGSTSTGDAGTAISKTYTTAGTYIIKTTVTDAGGLKSYQNRQVTVPVKYSVTGSVMRLDGTTPVAGASVRLKLGGGVVKMALTNAAGAYTLSNVTPGSYTVEAVKSGLIFSSTPAVVVTNANAAAATILATR